MCLVIEGTKLTPMNDSTTLFDVYCVVSVGDTKFTSGVMKVGDAIKEHT